MQSGQGVRDALSPPARRLRCLRRGTESIEDISVARSASLSESVVTVDIVSISGMLDCRNKALIDVEICRG